MDKDEATFNINGNPGTGNTFIHIGKAINVNPAATTVTTTINVNAGGADVVDAALQEAGFTAKSDSPKLKDMTYRTMLRNGLIDTRPLCTAITVYVSKIRCYIKNDKLTDFDRLWKGIFNLDVMKVELFDPGKQKSSFNRNLVANIIHYLDSKGFYSEGYNPNDMARALEDKGADSPVTKSLRCNPDKEYRDAIDGLIRELEAGT